MKYYLKNWRLDIVKDNSDNPNEFGDLLGDFLNFVNCPADSVGLDASSNLAVIGETVGNSEVIVSGITLITKIIDNCNRLRVVGEKNKGPCDYQLITLSGDEYYLLDMEMDADFRREYVSGEKIVHFSRAAAL